MNYHQIRQELTRESLETETMFSVLGGIANHVNDRQTHNEGRDLVIRALARKELCGQFEMRILPHLFEALVSILISHQFWSLSKTKICLHMSCTGPMGLMPCFIACKPEFTISYAQARMSS